MQSAVFPLRCVVVTGAAAPTTAVVARATGGDQQAVETIYRWLAPAVLGYLRGAGVRDAEDLTSDVFVAVVQRLPTFEGDAAALRRWVFTIAHHRLVDHRRRASRRVEEPVEMPGPTGGSVERLASVEFEDTTAARLDAAPALRALDGLTPDQRSVVLLRLIADLSVTDTARILGKEEGAVKALTRRALASLARALVPVTVS